MKTQMKNLIEKAKQLSEDRRDGALTPEGYKINADKCISLIREISTQPTSNPYDDLIHELTERVTEKIDVESQIEDYDMECKIVHFTNQRNRFVTHRL